MCPGGDNVTSRVDVRACAELTAQARPKDADVSIAKCRSLRKQCKLTIVSNKDVLAGTSVPIYIFKHAQ